MKKFFCIITLAALGTSAYGQQTLSLQECLARAMEGNYGVRIARNQLQIAENNVTYAPFLPTLTAAGRQNFDSFHDRTGYPDGQPDVKSDYRNNLYTADVTLGWRLFDGMAMFATRETSKELLRAGELSLVNNMERLAVDICSQYYYIITQQGRLDAARRYLEISTLRYNQAHEKYVIGSISGLEMKQAKIDFNADSSRLVRQQELIANAYIALFEMMNGDLGSTAQLGDSITPYGGLSLDALAASAQQNNTSIRLARNGQRLSELDLRIARSSLYPTLDFTSSYRYNYSSKSTAATRFTDYHGPSFGFTASVKLFDRLETRRKIRNAQIGQSTSDLLYDQTCMEVTSSLAQSYNTYRKNFMMIAFEQESADAAMLNLEAAMEMYRLGSMSGVEFREIQRSYLEAEERKLDAIYNAKLSEINLLYLSGQIL